MVKSNSFVLISTFKHALVVFDNKKMVGPPSLSLSLHKHENPKNPHAVIILCGQYL